MGRCSAYVARRQIGIYISQIERQIYKIQKSFNDMDFENADARNEVEDIINNMISELRSLLNELNSYHFS
ncbi:MAG: hypothetical protein PHV03_08315 [Desulfitobacteriaceae bacterium]|nr:hypothetical protein [Desulfitobacteriaceae bacterium]MDD4401889.1 hypothetical protein [Desulfitobacteriaceae bacterium]